MWRPNDCLSRLVLVIINHQPLIQTDTLAEWQPEEVSRPIRAWRMSFFRWAFFIWLASNKDKLQRAANCPFQLWWTRHAIGDKFEICLMAVVVVVVVVDVDVDGTPLDWSRWSRQLTASSINNKLLELSLLDERWNEWMKSDNDFGHTSLHLSVIWLTFK